ncbi:hypothetical protein DL93DRAFT_2093944 [Clavulina sp. PMI_390]|nr:hypothetical protein DL93DRAFT_2093944 [Clavulina sp. PMI_390]
MQLGVMTHDDDASSLSIAVGITVGLIASLVQSLGLTIQRKSHIMNQALPEDKRKADYRRPLWLLGFTVFLSSNLFGSLFQIASLPVVILAPLGAISLLWNAFFARVILGDTFSRYMFLGTLGVVVGAVLIAVYGVVPEPAHSLDDLLKLFGRTSFVVYFSLLGTVVGIVLIATHTAEWSYNRHQRMLAQMSGACTPPDDESAIVTLPLVPPAPNLPTASEVTPLLMGADPKPHVHISPSRASSIRSFLPSNSNARTPTILAISYASISGLLSGMCLIFAKSAVELLLVTAQGKNQFWRFESWLLLISLGVFALAQLWYLQKSLTLGDPTLVCPGIVILLLGVGAVSALDSSGEGEPSGGITDGDWTVAEAVATAGSPPANPSRPLGRRATIAVGASSQEADGRGTYGATLRPHQNLDTTARRAVSSPSAISTAPDGEALELLIEEEPEETTFPDPDYDMLVRSDPSLPPPHQPLASPSITPLPRGRTLSDSTPNIVSSPPQPQAPWRSPPRRRGRRATFLSHSRGSSSTHFNDNDPPQDGDADAVIAAPPLPGFSFGLSPLSPGFSLIPKHRPEGENGEHDENGEGLESAGNGRRKNRWGLLRNAVKHFGRRASDSS